MFYQKRLIDLLDRKFDLVNKLPPQEFLLELENFVHFIQSDETLSIYINHLFNRFKRKEQEYSRDRERLVEQLIPVRQKLVEMFPDSDDSAMPIPPDLLPDMRVYYEYRDTLANFDRVIGDIQEKIKNGELIKSNDMVITLLAGVLRKKLSIQQLDQAVVEDIILELDYIEALDLHLRRRIENYYRVSPEASLIALYDMINRINPAPHRYESVDEVWGIEALRRLISNETRIQEKIQKIVYEGGENEELIELCKICLRRAYEGIRAEIGSQSRVLFG